MKKIMIAFVAIVSAIATNAASMNWGADYTYASGGTGEAGVSRGTTDAYIAFVFDAATFSYADAKSLYDANKGAELASKAVGNVTVSADDLGGFMGSSNFSGAGGDTISAYVVIFDAASVDSSKNMYISETVSATIPTSGVAGNFSFGEGGDMVGMASASAWTASTAAVPEPTSGLLLLLGMAGLALRRKQA